MTKVIGVRFRTAGKVYFFDPLQLEIKRGDHVIVETARGIEFGTVVAGVHEVEVLFYGGWTYRLPRTGKGSGKCVQDPYRAASDWCP